MKRAKSTDDFYLALGLILVVLISQCAGQCECRFETTSEKTARLS